MPRRAAMWPTELSDHLDFLALTQPAQWLFQHLWLHPELNAGGFIAFNANVLAKAAHGITPEDIEASLDGLLAQKMAAIDDNTGELFLRLFIEFDSSRKPNIYINAMRAIQTARSPMLRQEAWGELQRIHPPPLERDPKKNPKVYDKLERQRDEAYEQLRGRISRTLAEPFPNRSRTVREPLSETETEPGHENEPGRSRTNSESEPSSDGVDFGECPRCRQAQSLGPEARDGENPMWCGDCNFAEADGMPNTQRAS